MFVRKLPWMLALVVAMLQAIKARYPEYSSAIDAFLLAIGAFFGGVLVNGTNGGGGNGKTGPGPA